MNYSQPFLVHQLEDIGRNWSIYDVKDQFKHFIYKTADAEFERGNAERDAIRTEKEINKRRKTMREKFIAAIGGLPSSDTPLNSKITGVIQDDGFRIEKIIFESRPNVFVTANMYIPDGIVKPRGAVQFLSGHFEQAKHADEYQVVCRTLVKAGLVVFAQDPVGQGERHSYYESSLKFNTFRWGTGEHDYAGVQCLPAGQSIARYFVHDSMRGIDYLCTRPEVDKSKIGVTGNSGGGTQTSLMMVCDERIAAAAPATYLMSANGWMHTGGAQDLEQVWPGMTAAGFEHEDILLIMSPRPVLVLAVTYDFFPIEATRQTVARARNFWDICGRSTNLELFEDVNDHHYTRAMAAKSAEFFALHLLGKKVKVDNSKVSPIPAAQLYATKTGQVRGELKNARFVYDENKANIEQILKIMKNEPEKARKARALEWLKAAVFNKRKPCPQNLRICYSGHANDLCFNNVFWWSQEGIINQALVFRDYRFADRKLPLTIAVWTDGTNQLRSHMNWLRNTCAAGRAVMVLNVTGVGAMEPRKINSCPTHEWYGTICRLAHALMWLGDSIPAFRAYDVIRALDAAQELPDINVNDIELYGHGRQSVYALIAAALDPRIKALREEDPLSGYADLACARHYDDYDINSIIFHGILKYCDLPDIRKWLGKKYQ